VAERAVVVRAPAGPRAARLRVEEPEPEPVQAPLERVQAQRAQVVAVFAPRP